jgi:hypothetical protein
MNVQKAVRAVVVVAVVALASYAYAGAKYEYPLKVDTVGRTMFGAFSSTRNSTPPTIYTYFELSCYAAVYVPGAAARGGCYGYDPQGNWGSCATSDPQIVDIIKNLTGEQLVHVAWDVSGTCTSITAYTMSMTPPKAP